MEYREPFKRTKAGGLAVTIMTQAVDSLRIRSRALLLASLVIMLLGVAFAPLRVEASCAPPAPELLDTLWYQIDIEQGWITRVEFDYACAHSYTGYKIRIFAWGDTGDVDWGWTRASYKQGLVHADYQLLDAHVKLTAGLAQDGEHDGQLVLYEYITPDDGSKPQSYVEYFSRLAPHFVALFQEAEQQAREAGFDPGKPVNELHFWNDIIIRDYWQAATKQEGAIIWGGPASQADPQYVGGGAWEAFKRAFWSYGVWPGYPINLEHDWGQVRIQDLRGGEWGDGALIGGDRAELVAGRHWSAYIQADGSNRLRNPTSFIVERFKQRLAWRVQLFEGGEIWVNNLEAWVTYYDTGEHIKLP